MGFEMAYRSEREPEPRAFLLTWKADRWPYENIIRMRKAFLADGYVDEPWRIIAHRQAQPGDRVWLLKQGKGPKGIFGMGSITGRPFEGDIGRGKLQWLAGVRFTAFVEPLEPFLVDEDATRRILGPNLMNSQASGVSLTGEQSVALAKIIREIPWMVPMIDAGTADDEAFDPANLKDARERIARSIAVRRGQRAFRDALISAYGGRCAITGCEVLDVLEAAHIFPYRGPETNRVTNGLLLRADVHTLFDCGLIEIDQDTLSVTLSPRSGSSDYSELNGMTLRHPTKPAEAPSRAALAMRRSVNM